jgi:alpha-ketoglutarate-dependent taurine dioxygenase
MKLPTDDLTPRIGTSVAVDSATLLGGFRAEELRALLDQRGVLVFPRVALDDAEQLAFARTLGEVIDQGDKGIYKVTLDVKESATAEYLKGTFYWHFDGWSDDAPSRATILSCRATSQEGGQTDFANTYAAWDDLPASEQASLEKLRVVHTMETIQRLVYPDASEAQIADWRNHVPKSQPLVWTHQTGRKSLVLGYTASHIEGMPEAEGRALIAELLAWATKPQYVYRHQWSVGDIVVWDNTGTMHRVVPYRADSGRMMHRTTLVAEEMLV